MNREQMIDMLAKALAPQTTPAPVDLRRLAEPFPVDAVSWRVGTTTKDKTKGMALAYIDARDVMDRLDATCGADWQDQYEAMPDGSYCCRIGIKIDGEWRWRSDGALMLTDSEKIDAKEMAQKGSYSDAFKRAAVKWGIGRYLYNLDSPWVKIEARGNSYVIADEGKAALRAVLLRHAKSLTEGPQPPRPVAPPVSEPTQPQQPTEAPTPSTKPQQTNSAKADAASVPAAPSKSRIADKIPAVPPTQHPVPGHGQFNNQQDEWKQRELTIRSKREADKALKALTAIEDDIGAAEPAHIAAKYAKWVKDTEKVKSQFVGPDIKRVADAVRAFKVAAEIDQPAHDEDGVILERSE